VLEQGRIAAEEMVSLPRPRDVDGDFQALRRRLLGHLGVHGHTPDKPSAGEPEATEAAELIAFRRRQEVG